MKQRIRTLWRIKKCKIINKANRFRPYLATSQVNVNGKVRKIKSKSKT